MVGRVQQDIRNGEVSSCGVVLAVTESVQGVPSGKLLMFNGSFSLGEGAGLVKGRASEIDVKSLLSGRASLEALKPLETTNVWMKAPGAPATTPIKGQSIRKSDDPGYLIYLTDLTSVIELTKAVRSNQQIQIGMRIKSRDFDQALFGTVQMTEAQTQQFDQCINEWVNRMTTKYGLGESADRRDFSSSAK